jgi:hypothetical protein
MIPLINGSTNSTLYPMKSVYFLVICILTLHLQCTSCLNDESRSNLLLGTASPFELSFLCLKKYIMRKMHSTFQPISYFRRKSSSYRFSPQTLTHIFGSRGGGGSGWGCQLIILPCFSVNIFLFRLRWVRECVAWGWGWSSAPATATPQRRQIRSRPGTWQCDTIELYNVLESVQELENNTS